MAHESGIDWKIEKLQKQVSNNSDAEYVEDQQAVVGHHRPLRPGNDGRMRRCVSVTRGTTSFC
jgi:hypothetical protein